MGKLVDSRIIRNVSDIYLLTREDLLRVSGDNSVDALLSAILASKEVDLWRLIHGIGIEGVGARAAKQLAREMQTFENLANASVERLRRVEGVGPPAAENAAEYFTSVEARQLLASWTDGQDTVLQAPED